MQALGFDQEVLDVALDFNELILGLVLDVGTDVRLEVDIRLEHSGDFFGNVEVRQVELRIFEVDQGFLLLNAEGFAVVYCFGKVLQLYVNCERFE